MAASAQEFSSAIRSYLEYCEKTRRLSHHTRSAYRSDLSAFEALLDAESTDCPGIAAALKKIIQHPKHKPATIARKVMAVRGFLSWWDDSLAREVFSGLKFRMKQPKRLPKVIPRNDLNLLFAGAQNVLLGLGDNRLHLILLLLASTGLRVSELCSLRLSDIDIETGELKVFGKGAKERVVVIANATVRGALATYIDKYRDRTLLTAPLFCNKWGRAITPKWVQNWLKRATRISGVSRRITPHMFRHTAATLLIENGVDIRFVQRLLGHVNLATTEIYTHVSDQALRTALERADVMQRFVRP